MFKLFEVFGQLSLQGAEIADRALEGVTAKAEKVADGMDRMGDRVGAAGSTLSKGLTGPILAGTTALTGLAFRAMAAGDDLAKFGRSVNLNVEALQEYEFALGRVAGVSEGDTRKALQFLNRTLADGTQGVEKATEALTALGFSQEEIAAGAISTEQAMDRVFDAIRNATSAAEAQAIAMEVFGNRQGIAIANNIREGAETIDEARRIFREEVGGLSQEQAEAAEAAADAWGKFTKTLSNVALVAGAELLPAFTQIVEALDGRLGPAAKRFGEGLANLIEWFSNLSPFMQQAILWTIGFAAALGPLLLIFGRFLTLGAGLIRWLLTLGPLIAGVKTAFGIMAAAVAVIGAPIAAVIAGLALLGTWLFINRQRVGEWARSVVAWFVGVGDGARDMGNRAAEALNQFLRKIGEFVNRGLAAFRDFKDGAVQFVADMVVAITRAIGNMVTNVLRSIGEMVSGALSRLRRLYREAVGNSIIPDLARDVGAVLTGMADHALEETSRMATGMMASMADVAAPDLTPVSRNGFRNGEGTVPAPARVDLRHSTFVGDSSTEERLRRFGYDMFGGF